MLNRDKFFSYADDTIKCICGVTFSVGGIIYCPRCGQSYKKLNTFTVEIDSYVEQK